MGHPDDVSQLQGDGREDFDEEDGDGVVEALDDGLGHLGRYVPPPHSRQAQRHR